MYKDRNFRGNMQSFSYLWTIKKTSLVYENSKKYTRSDTSFCCYAFGHAVGIGATA